MVYPFFESDTLFLIHVVVLFLAVWRFFEWRDVYLNSTLEQYSWDALGRGAGVDQHLGPEGKQPMRQVSRRLYIYIYIYIYIRAHVRS